MSRLPSASAPPLDRRRFLQTSGLLLAGATPGRTVLLRATGAAPATALCSTCHSAEYVLDPPSTSPLTSWQATGTKRQKTFAAPIPDYAVAPIVGTRPKSPLAHFALDRVLVALIAPTACSLKSNRGNPTAK